MFRPTVFSQCARKSSDWKVLNVDQEGTKGVSLKVGQYIGWKICDNVSSKRQSICKECKKTFKSIPLLRTHVTKMHSISKIRIVASLKTRSFTDRRNEKKFACSVSTCDNSFTLKKNMKDHVKRFHLKEEIVCGGTNLNGSICNLTFSRVGEHRKTHDKTIRFKCPSCEDKSYSSMSTLNRHKNATHVEKINCIICKKSYTSKGNLNVHISKVHNIHILC